MTRAQTKRDFYEVLGVRSDAEPEEVRAAYHKLAKQFHPDRNKAPEAVDRFKEIAEAYAILSDPEKRGRYDRSGFAGVADISPEELFGGMDFGNIFGRHGFDADFDFGGGGLFDRFFGRRQQSGKSKGVNISVEVRVPLAMVITGGEETVHFTHSLKCAECHGTGAAAETEPISCERCNGSGQQIQAQQREGYSFRQITMCPTCHGTGHIIETPCSACDGSGETQEAQTYSVKIPGDSGRGTVAYTWPGSSQHRTRRDPR